MTSQEHPAQKRAMRAAALLLLVLATVGLYARVVEHEFVSFDDPIYVTKNPHLDDAFTADGLRWAFTTARGANWAPLTWLSHALDYRWFGLERPGGHHATSVALHALTALLFVVAFARLTGAFWRSFFVGALFAFHPLRVESVAWVSERKDVLCGLFFAATLVAYASYARRPRPLAYAAVLVSYALCLLSKSMGVTLPFVLLLLDIWPLGRATKERYGKLILEKLPLIALALVAATVTFIAQDRAGAVSSLHNLPLLERVANATIGYAAYVHSTLWPTGLACFYPHPSVLDAPHSWVGVRLLAAVGTLTLITAVAIRVRRSEPSLLVGWLWFLGTLVPVIGFVQVGEQSTADRYTYVPSIGLALTLVWGGTRLAQRARIGNATLAVAGGAWIVALAFVTVRQIDTWATNTSLYEHALAVTDGNFKAHNNLGLALERGGDIEAAEAHFVAALEARSNYAPALINLGRVVHERGEFNRARALYTRALEVAPNASVHNNFGVLLLDRGDVGRAREHFERALELDANSHDVLRNLARLYAVGGNADRATEYLERLLELDQTDAWAWYELGIQDSNKRRFDSARRHFERATELEPDAGRGWIGLARVALLEARPTDAIRYFEEAGSREGLSRQNSAKLAYLYLEHGDPTKASDAFKVALEGAGKNSAWANELALLLTTSDDVSVRNLQRALAWARISVTETDESNWEYMSTLATVHAELGNRAEALHWQRKAVELAPSDERDAAVRRLRQLNILLEKPAAEER